MTEHAIQDLEQKETIDRNEFLNLLRNLQHALENHKPLEITLGGHHYFLPEDVGERSRFRVEYEIERGEYEFELTMKWR
jgi:amphi-Trp domain-containing protein